MSFITAIGTANPPHKFNQQQIADFMIRAMALNEDEAHKLRILYRASGIESRYSVLKDYGSGELFSFYSNNENLDPFPGTKERMSLFADKSVTLSNDAAKKCFDQITPFDPTEITHLIVVSCTGMFAPGLDIELTHTLGLSSTVIRTSINFMGCYAAFNALRVANSFCAQHPQSKVLVVCTELCSIHFQKQNTEDNILANALFADGSAALLIEAQPRNKINLSIGDFFCDLATAGKQEMAWRVGDHGFEMKLSSYVPETIRTGIKKLTQSLLSVNKISLSDIDYFAIHPGGKRILEAIEEELGLTKENNRFSYSVMKKYGNMSSPTVLFVLQEIFQKLSSGDHGKKILSFGFGPGLTLESLVLTVESGVDR